MDEILSANTQEVAEPETVEEAVVETQGEEEQEVAEPVGAEEVEEQAPQRDFEKDSAFAEMRRKAEQSEKAAKALENILRQMNYQGNNAEELALNAESDITGKPVEELLEERRLATELEQTKGELEELRQREGQRILSDDLKTLKQYYPELKEVKDVKELGIEFLQLRSNGIETMAAYEAVKATKAKTTPTKPQSTGSMKDTAPQAEKEYYTSEEVDQLTDKQLDDPVIMERVQKSMQKWGKKGWK